MPTQRHHLQYGAASNPHGRPRFVLRLPEFLFLGAVGLFLLTTQLKPRGGLQQPAAAPPAAAASKTASQLLASAAAPSEQQPPPQQPPAALSADKEKETEEIADLQERLRAAEEERDALKADAGRMAQMYQEQGAAALRLSGERDALKKQNREMEAAIRDGQHWARRPPLPLERQPPLRLPAWTLDHRFYALGAVLTRDQVDARLYLDLVIMGRKIFAPTYSSVLGAKDLDGEWAMGEAFNTMDPSEITKAGGAFFCRLGVDEAPTPASLVPAHTTLDPNVNGIVEIIRCPVPEKGKDGVLDVTFVLQDPGAPLSPPPSTDEGKGEEEGKDVEVERGPPPEPYDLLRVEVPRASRATGYFSYREGATALDAWQPQPDKLHLCVSGVTWRFTCPVLDLVLEFVEYHLQNGVDHIHFAMDFADGSEDMHRALAVLRDYIDGGKVSVLSTLTVHGPGFIGSDQYKLWAINSCLAYTKGMADWVGIWDLDEFLVPHDKGNNILETVEQLVKEDGRKGPEDTCYLRFTSYNHVGKTADTDRTWVGQMFAQGREMASDQTWQKVVVSARNTYYAGFHLPGACRREGLDWEQQLSWDEAIHVNDTVAAMHHYRNKFVHAGTIASENVTVDEYARDRFPAVLEALKKRKADETVAKFCTELPGPPSMEI